MRMHVAANRPSTISPCEVPASIASSSRVDTEVYWLHGPQVDSCMLDVTSVYSTAALLESPDGNDYRQLISTYV